MYKTLAVYYGGTFLVVMALNLGNFIATKNNTIQGRNESPPTSYPRAIQGSQSLFGRSDGGDGK